MNSGTKVLVTGGAGYIGSHTAKALRRAGFEPITFDNLSEGHDWAVRWGPLVRADLADPGAISEVLRTHQIEAVIHFAAHAYVGESVKAPRKYFRNNVTNTLGLLDAMLDCGVSRIVFSSTCATYGEPDRVPLQEGQAQRPVNPYGESKLFVEKALRWYESAYGMRWMALRYFNAAGADPDGEIGEQHNHETHLVPLAIQAALGLRSHIEVYGNDYATPDGTAIRDYVHVTDLAEAHVKALVHLFDGGSSMALNLGSGTGSSVREIITAVERVSRRGIDARNAARRNGDPAILLADVSKARDTLAWTQCHSNWEAIVNTAWRWHNSTLRAAVAH